MSYFNLTLDTTPPILHIYAPAYTTIDSHIVLTVEADEELSASHSVSLVDQEGVRHDAVLSHMGTYLEGVIPFDGYPAGIVNITVTAEDLVGNVSTAQVAITIVGSNRLRMRVSETAMKVVGSEATMNVRSEEKTCKLISTDQEIR